MRGFRDASLEAECEPEEGKQGLAKMIVYN